MMVRKSPAHLEQGSATLIVGAVSVLHFVGHPVSETPLNNGHCTAKALTVGSEMNSVVVFQQNSNHCPVLAVCSETATVKMRGSDKHSLLQANPI